MSSIFYLEIVCICYNYIYFSTLENDKENDSRTGQATQAVIQRRRRPKRRSTGVARFDKDDIDPDRQESPGDGDDKEVSNLFYLLLILKKLADIQIRM